jgi:hypothetical protein
MVPEEFFAAMTALPSLKVVAVSKYMFPSLYDTDFTKSPTEGVVLVPNDSHKTATDDTVPTDVEELP